MSQPDDRADLTLKIIGGEPRSWSAVEPRAAGFPESPVTSSFSQPSRYCWVRGVVLAADLYSDVGTSADLLARR